MIQILLINCIRLDFYYSILEHDDSLTDRIEGGILDTNFKATKSLWYNVYKKDYIVEGGMYRGEPPIEFFNVDWVVKSRGDRNNEIKKFIGPDSWSTMNHYLLTRNIGASSVGRDVESRLSWMSVDYPGAFLEPQPKSTSRGVNANEKKVFYVFGDGGKSWHLIYVKISHRDINTSYLFSSYRIS